MSKSTKRAVAIRQKQVKRVPQLTFAQERARIKLPYKPAHVTEEQIKEAIQLVAA